MKNKVTVVRKSSLVFSWILFFGTLIILLFSSCMHHSEQQSETGDNSLISQEDMFRVIYTNFGMSYCVVYDVETKVEYVVSTGMNNRGTFTMRVDSTGKPMLYKK